MGLRNIRIEGDEILRKKSRIVEKIDDKIITLLDDMIETMNDSNGVGLAAPQVGVLKRVITIDIGEGPIELINPEILEVSGQQLVIEGCLSIPTRDGKTVQGELNRPKWVKVKALNRNSEEFEIEGEGLLAQALCHEIDHLEGILFIDKIIRYVEGE